MLFPVRVSGPRFRSAVELGQDDDRNLEFLGQGFQPGGDFRYFTFTAVGRLFGVGAHELEIVNANSGQSSQIAHDPASLGPKLIDRNGSRVVNDQLGRPKVRHGLLEVLHL